MKKSLRKLSYFKTEKGWNQLCSKVNRVGPANLISITENELKYTIFFWEM